MNRFFIGLILIVFTIGHAAAMTTLPGGLTLEQVSQAPWIFLGEVISTEMVTDGMTPAAVSPKWQAQYTRFRVIQGVKGDLHTGYEVELKECGPRHVPSHAFCGNLYPSAPNSKVGDLFFVITGPGNPNVFGYQTSIRLPANRVPVTPRMTLPSGQEGVPSADGVPSLMGIAEGFGAMPMSESGWLIDLSRVEMDQKVSLPTTDPAEKGRMKAHAFSMESTDVAPPPLLMPGSNLVDLNRLVERLNEMGGK